MANDRITKTVNKLSNLMMKNLGRWCEITIKKTGEKFKVVRTGYGSMEHPERDSAELKTMDGEIVYEAKNLYDMAKWLCERY